VITTEDLTRNFGTLVAVDRLNVHIKEGDIYGFLGPNGAGKTTTIRMLSTLIKPTSGTACIMGFDVQTEPNRARRAIGIMPERPGFYEEMSGRKQLRFYGEFYQIPRAKLDPRIEELMGRVGMGRWIDANIKTYSHGMRKRLAIAQALLHDPRILILDEPSTGLDPAGVMEFRELIRSLNKEGYTIFLSSHMLPEIQQVCNRVGILRRGVLVAEDTIDNLRDQLISRSADRITVVATGIDETIMAKVRAIEGIANAEVSQWGMLVMAEQGTSVQAELNHVLVTSGAKVTAFTTLQPTLEDVFLDITGGESDV
jgi:ABC-2 type transport system ATP-binding protein